MLIRVLMLIAGILAIAGCGQSEQVIKIGIIAPLTGEGASYGASMKRGISLAFEGNDDVGLVFEDSKLKPKDGVSAIKKLISFDKVDFIYGAASSGVSLAIAPIAADEKIVLLSSISTSDKLTDINDYFFRNVPKNALQGFTAASYLVARGGIATVAVFNENDEYGANLAESFKDSLESTSLKLVYESSYLSSDTDFRTQLTKIKNIGADAVFIPGNYEETGMILRQAREVGLDAIFVGGDGSYSPSLIEYAGAVAEGFVCTIMGIDKSSPKYREFEVLFTEKYGQGPDVYDTYAYEAGLIIKQALMSENPKAILSSGSFETFSGELAFVGSDVVRPYGLAVVSNGKFIDL